MVDRHLRRSLSLVRKVSNRADQLVIAKETRLSHWAKNLVKYKIGLLYNI